MSRPNLSLTVSSQQVKPSESDIQRFWKRVVKSTHGRCWIWNGPKTLFGYGQLTFGNRPITAHRLSWLIHNGAIPDGLCVLHNCPNRDNPSCVNPAHLWLGSNIDNSKDRHVKGRDAIGEIHGLSKLTDDKIREIRERKENGATQRRMARDYGVHVSTIRSVIRYKTWKGVR